MRTVLTFIVLAFFGATAAAQVPQARPTTAPAQPLPVRQVSGIVKDSTDQAVIGAIVTLTSSADTLKASTNADGVFVFRTVKSWVFTLTVNSMGYRTYVKKGQYNDATARLTMDPVILRNESKLLNEVVINGTPSIVYKTDTVEYKASDYVVRAGATVDELLKKMEGFDVTSDGQVTHNGQAVGRARLNGKDLYGGDVASVIQSLPADIIEKAQVVDDYGDVARRTGVKEGDAQKVLNLTTRTDKSVGNMARLNGGLGTTDRYEASINLTRVNGNQTIGLTINNLSKFPNGVAGGNASVGRLGVVRANGRGGNQGGAGNVSGGSTFNFDPRFSYRDQIGQKVEYNINYSFNYNNPFNITQSSSTTVNPAIPVNGGVTESDRYVTGNNYSRSHVFDAELEYSIDSSNFIQFRPTIRFTSGDNYGYSTQAQLGAIHQNQINNSTTSTSTPNVNATVAFQHIWLKKPSRSFSLEGTLGRNKNFNDSYQYNNIQYYNDVMSTTVPVKDSLVNRLITAESYTNNYRGSMTYTEPIGKTVRLELNSNMEVRSYDNSRLTSNLRNGTAVLVDSLSNIFDYSFTQFRNSLNFRFGTNTSLTSLSIGATAVNTHLEGTKASLKTAVDQTYFKVIPIARFQLRFSRQHVFSANYNGRAQEPSFDQIQPVKDVSNPQNAIVGNPNLKVAFVHGVNAQYGNYIANSALQYQFNLNAQFTDNQVTSNSVTVPDVFNSFKRETRYLNVDGNHSHTLGYNLQKSFSDRRFSFRLSGTVNQTDQITFSDNIRGVASRWDITESLGPQINPTTWLEINPEVSYRTDKTDVTLPRALDTYIKTWAYSLYGNVYFLKNFQFGYSLSKNFVDGVQNTIGNQNPFIINLSLQTRVFKNKAGLQIRAFDLLNQNNFVNVTNTGTVTSRIFTNPVSRYFMVNLSMNLQKWTGAGGNGRQVIRRGDGSFQNN